MGTGFRTCTVSQNGSVNINNNINSNKVNKNSKQCKKKHRQAKIVSWNVRTLSNRKNLYRQDEFIADLVDLQVAVACLQETKLSSGILSIDDYKIYCSGTESGSEQGVAIAVKKKIKVKDINTTSSRIMSMKIDLFGQWVAVICCYAPTSAATILERENFYADLQAEMKRHSGVATVICGDMNARVGKSLRAAICEDELEACINKVRGHHGLDEINESGNMLMDFCDDNKLRIMTTWFEHPRRFYETWTHAASKKSFQLDHIMCSYNAAKFFTNVKAYRGGLRTFTDHIPVVASLRFLRVKSQAKAFPRSNKRSRPKRLNVRKIDGDSITQTKLKTDFNNRVQELLHEGQQKDTVQQQNGRQQPNELSQAGTEAQPGVQVQQDSDLSSQCMTTNNIPYDRWSKAIRQAGEEICGLKESVKRPLWQVDNAERLERLSSKKKQAHEKSLNYPTEENEAAYRAVRRNVRNEVRSIYNSWYSKIAEGMEESSEKGNMRGVYAGIKSLAAKGREMQTAAIKDISGNLLTDDTSIMKRWEEHFHSVFNNFTDANLDIIDKIPARPQADHLVDPITLEELQAAIKLMKKRKSHGLDGIECELIRSLDRDAQLQLVSYMNVFMKNPSSIPKSWKDAAVVILHKSGKDRTVCDSYRGISLLSIVYKVFGKVINLRMNAYCEKEGIYPESQCGFRKGRSTADMITAIRLLIEMCQEQDKSLYISFLDLTKAYDLCNRSALWKILSRIGIPEGLVKVLQALHEDMEIFIDSGGSLSNPIKCANGVRQGDNIAATLFNIFFSIVIWLWKEENKGDVKLISKMDGYMRNNFKNWDVDNRNVIQSVIQDFLYADDAGFCNHDPALHKQQIKDFQRLAESLGLKLSIKKSETMTVNAADKCIVEMDGGKLAVCMQFRYLGSIICDDGDLQHELARRISRAQGAWNTLSHVWKDNRLTVATKVRIYKASVLPVLLYGCETWAVSERQVRRLESFQIRCVKKLAKTNYLKMRDNGISYLDLLQSLSSEKAKLHTIRWTMQSKLLSWVGHLARMDDNRIPKLLLFGKFPDPQDNQQREDSPSQNAFLGRWNRYRDVIHKALEEREVMRCQWYEMARIRKIWRKVVSGDYQPENHNPNLARPVPRANGRGVKRPPVHKQKIARGADEIIHCGICQHPCRGFIGLAKHTKMAHPEGTFRADGFQCPKCPRRFQTESHFAEHMNLHEKSEDQRKTCGSCGEVYSNAAFEHHSRYCRANNNRYKCSTEGCGYSTNVEQHLKAHMSSKHGVVSNKTCNLCGFEVRVPSELERHKEGPKCRLLRGLSPIRKKQNCDICGVAIATRQLSNHMNSEKCLARKAERDAERAADAIAGADADAVAKTNIITDISMTCRYCPDSNEDATAAQQIDSDSAAEGACCASSSKRSARTTFRAKQSRKSTTRGTKRNANDLCHIIGGRPNPPVPAKVQRCRQQEQRKLEIKLDVQRKLSECASGKYPMNKLVLKSREEQRRDKEKRENKRRKLCMFCEKRFLPEDMQAHLRECYHFSTSCPAVKKTQGKVTRFKQKKADKQNANNSSNRRGTKRQATDVCPLDGVNPNPPKPEKVVAYDMVRKKQEKVASGNYPLSTLENQRLKPARKKCFICNEMISVIDYQGHIQMHAQQDVIPTKRRR